MGQEHRVDPERSPADNGKSAPPPLESPEHRLAIAFDGDDMGLVMTIDGNAALSVVLYKAIKLLLRSFISCHETDTPPFFIEAGSIRNVFNKNPLNEKTDPEKVAAEKERERRTKERRIKEYEQAKNKFYSNQARFIQCRQLLDLIEAAETDCVRARIDGVLKAADCPAAAENQKTKIMDLSYDEILSILHKIVYHLERIHQ